MWVGVVLVVLGMVSWVGPWWVIRAACPLAVKVMDEAGRIRGERWVRWVG